MDSYLTCPQCKTELVVKTRYPDAGWSETRAADENRDRAAEAAAVSGEVTVAEQQEIQSAVTG